MSDVTDDYRPGVFRCAKCGLRSVTFNMDVTTGFTEGAHTSDCPNGCGPAWPVTWKDDCLSAERELEETCDRLASRGRETPPQDRLSRDRDIILQAINTYDGWLVDDDYDARRCLDEIIAKMRERLALALLLPASEGGIK